MNHRATFARLLHFAVADGVPRCSLNVAIVVGVVLNAINQGYAFLGQGSVSWPKIVLTFLVPYCVSTFGAVSAKLRQARRSMDVR